jgi:phosphatidylglycerol:prolipoprotein diacylglycerol transferase
VVLASIPSPPRGVIYLGPLPIRAYALFIIAGIVVAVVVGNRRLVARGGPDGAMAEVATWAVPFGLAGARLYHVVTNPELYWGAHGQGTAAAFEVWHGGLGIWGGVLGGALGAWIACRLRGLNFAVVADALAPGLVLAQAVGRWGNYFNQELFGLPSNLPWAIEIAPVNRPSGFTSEATFHPTFLYESIWDVLVCLILLFVARRFADSLKNGDIALLYVCLYSVGRFFVETLRIDPAFLIGDFRGNLFVASVLALTFALILFLRHAGRSSPRKRPTGS